MIKAYYNNRYELKYVLDFATYCRLRKEIQVMFRKDSYGGSNGRYKVISLYYDTSGLMFYWEKIDGEERRAKLRLRTYVHDGMKDGNKNKGKRPDVFIEIKKKINQNVMKRRVLIDEKKAKELISRPYIDHDFLDTFDEKGKETLKEVMRMKSILRLRPTTVVSYTREAFISKDNLNVRVTFDSNIKYRDGDFSLKTSSEDRHMLHPSLVVMEIKYSDYFPLWLVQMIQKYTCNVQTFSKYCNSINSLFYEKPIMGEICGMVY